MSEMRDKEHSQSEYSSSKSTLAQKMGHGIGMITEDDKKRA